MTLSIEHLNKSFGDRPLFSDFSIQIEEGAVTCLLGPSGCGKTTFLNMISRVVPADSGEFKGFDQKTVSYIFQEPRLLPWETVPGNISFVLRDAYPKTEREKITARMVELVGLKGEENKFPGNLSGGMKQRVAIARAFAYPSDILLMDEPFKGLDVKLKTTIMQLFLKVWQENRKTVIFVTHDIDEAIALGQRICVLSKPPVTVLEDLPVLEKKEAVIQDIKEQLLKSLS